MGNNLYQWDGNAGDIERNTRFARNLVTDLEARFPIDTSRVYATGFSSGANMAAQFLGDPASPFRGVAPIAGGDWTRLDIPTITKPTRLYAAAGYRDYLWPYARKTADFSKRAGLADEDIFLRRHAGGHEIHGWEIEELWRFLDEGERPAPGSLDAAWTAEVLPDPADVNALGLDGTTLVAAGARGHVWRRDSTWTVERTRASIDYATLCFANGRGFVGGMSSSAHLESGVWSDLTNVPDYGMLGAPYITAADCRADGSIVIGGYWSQAISTNGGASWSQFTATSSFGNEAQIAAIATSTSGATVLAGYYFLGRAAPSSLAATSSAEPHSWLNAVASSGTHFWAVGDNGQIFASLDDGISWTEQSSGTREDLYAVHFLDAQHGAAAGRNGTVMVTDDGGSTWQPRVTGVTTTLAAVRLDDSTLWIGGQDGLLAHAPR